MKKYKYILAVLSFSVVCSAMVTDLGAQEPRNRNYDLEYVRRQNGWLSSSNGSGLRFAPVSVSYAEGYFDKHNGKFMNYYESPDSYDAGLKTESFRSFEKISFYGKLQYEYFHGKDMCGSMLIEPDEYPYGLLEFTPGIKIRERYILSGGFGVSLWGGLSAGLVVNYETDNYAKRKNLRHKNTRMDFEAMPGLAYTWGGFTLGLNYIYAKKTEVIEAEAIGKNTEYDAFYNRGLWFGNYGLYNGGLLHLDEMGMTGYPIKNVSNGGALQLGFGYGNFNMFNEFAARHTRGENGQIGYIWYHDRVNSFDYRGTINITGDRIVHLIRGGASYSSLRGYENIITRETILNVVKPVIYGESETLKERKLHINLEYEQNWGAKDCNPLLSLRIGGEHFKRSTVSFLMYPEYRWQYLNMFRVYMGADRNFMFRKSCLKAGLNLGYYTGKNQKLHEGRIDGAPQGMTTSDYPYLLQEYMDYEYEYLTSPRMEYTLNIRYTRMLGRARIPVYIDAKFTQHASLCDVEFIDGKTRNLFSVKVGCIF